MKKLLPLLLLNLTGCASPTWQGLHGGVQNADGVSVYGLALWGVAGGTAHIQPILPVNGSPPLLGVGIDWRLDTLFSTP